MSQHLRQESAMKLTVRLLHALNPCLTDDQKKGLFGRVYDEVMATLKEHDVKLGREMSRLGRPSAN